MVRREGMAINEGEKKLGEEKPQLHLQKPQLHLQQEVLMAKSSSFQPSSY